MILPSVDQQAQRLLFSVVLDHLAALRDTVNLPVEVDIDGVVTVSG